MNTPQLTKRIAALLLTVKNNKPPWADDGQPGNLKAWPGAELCEGDANEPGEWVMCCGHVYSDMEISAMVKAGWISISPELGRFGRFKTAPGPALDEALRTAPAYNWIEGRESASSGQRPASVLNLYKAGKSERGEAARSVVH